MTSDTEHFDLRGQDEYSEEFAISIAINVARGFLQNHDVTTRQIIGLGKALYALERLPASTPGVAVECGTCRPAGALGCGDSPLLYTLRSAGARGLDVLACYKHIAHLERKVEFFSSNKRSMDFQ